MAVITDTLLTTFAVSGLTSLLGAFTRVESGLAALQRANYQLNTATSSGQTVRALLAQKQATQQLQYSMAVLGQTALTLFLRIAQGAQQALRRFVEFGGQVQSIAQETGASFREAAQITTLFQVAGISDMQRMRDLVRLSNDLKDPNALAGLGKLGVTPSYSKSGVQLFNEIADALGRMKDGLYKTQAEEQIFGQRGVTALQPLLRMSHAQRQETLDLANAFDTRMLPVMQQYQVASALLGQTIMIKLVYPLANAFLPVMLKAVRLVTGAVNLFDRLNNAFGGTLSVLIGVAVATYTIGRGITLLVGAYKAFNAVLQTNAKLQVLLTALQGPKGLAQVAVALGVAGAAAYGINKLLEPKQEKKDDSSNRFSDAVDKFSGAIDTWTSFNRGGIPKGLVDGQGTGYNLSALERMQALAAVE